MENEFKKYATKHLGMSSTALESYMNITSSYISPTIIEERQLNVAQMDVFSRLMMDRIIFLGTQIDDYTANVIQAQLLYLDSSDPGKDISIYINSPGGSVYAGLGIYDKGKRCCLTHSRVLIHQPMSGVQGQASDMEIAVREVLKVKDELYRIISEHSGKPYEVIARDSDRDYWMNAQEALEYGMVDEIMKRK